MRAPPAAGAALGAAAVDRGGVEGAAVVDVERRACARRPGTLSVPRNISRMGSTNHDGMYFLAPNGIAHRGEGAARRPGRARRGRGWR